MLKKITALLGALMLTVGIGAAGANAEVLINEDFEGAKLGVFNAANQEGTDCDMHLVDDTILSSGYTLNGQAFTEADIVSDGGSKVLRMNAAIKDSYTAYPVVTSDVKLPNSGKVILELRMKVNRSMQTFLRYRNYDQGGYNLLRLDRQNGSLMGVKYNQNTWTNPVQTITYAAYHDYKYILDIDNNLYTFYIDDVLMADNVTPTGPQPLKGNTLFIWGAPVEAPTKTFTEGSATDIAKITYDGFIYIDTFKMTAIEDTKLIKATPADGTTDIVPPKYVSFEYNNSVTATAAMVNGEAAEITYDNDSKTVKVNYAFENEKEYLVTLSGIVDELGNALDDQMVIFSTKAWSTDDVSDPVKPVPEDKSVYYINENFDTATNENITPSTPASGWSWTTQTNVAIEDGKLKLLPGADFRIGVTKKTHPEVTVFDYEVFLGTGAKQFNIERLDGGFRALALWQYGYLDAVEHEEGSRVAGLTAGEWHNVRVVLSGSKRDIYIDKKLAVSFEETADLANTYAYRFKLVVGTSTDPSNYALFDDLKIYTASDEVVLTGVSPAFDAVDVSTAAQVEFTYSDAIGDATGAIVTLNAQPVDAKVIVNEGKAIVTFNELLDKNTVYTVALSGLKTVLGNVIEKVETRFSTTQANEDEWYVSELRTQTTPDNAANKDYTVTVRTTLEGKTAQLIVATYDASGKLIGVGFSEKTTLTSGTPADITASARFYSGCSTQCFLWENVDSMIPVWGIIE